MSRLQQNIHSSTVIEKLFLHKETQNHIESTDHIICIKNHLRWKYWTYPLTWAPLDTICIWWNGWYGVRLRAWSKLGRKFGSTHQYDPLPIP